MRSKEAQALKYPPGIDTIAYWGNGRLQVILNNVFDVERMSEGPILQGVVGFAELDGWVLFAGDAGYFTVEIKTMSYRAYPTITEAPADTQERLREIDVAVKSGAGRANGVTLIDPKTLRPTHR